MTAGRGPGRLHRRRRAGGARRRGLHVRLRPGQAGASWRPTGRIALREAIMACRNGGIVSVIGVYGGFIDKFPMGAVMNRSLTIRTGQCHVHRYMQPLLERIEHGEIDPSFVITHRMPLEDAPARLRDVPEQGGRLREDRALTLGRGFGGAADLTGSPPTSRRTALCIQTAVCPASSGRAVPPRWTARSRTTQLTPAVASASLTAGSAGPDTYRCQLRRRGMRRRSARHPV